MKSNRLVFSLLLGISALFADVFSPRQAAHASLNQTVEEFGNYVIYHWEQDPQLSTFNPPQIITNVQSTTKVLGGCISNHGGRIATDVGGTSYCPVVNTIYVVQEELEPFYEDFGPAAIAYVIAHEYSHYLQNVFDVEYVQPISELQADCLAGAILGQGAADLQITSSDIINMAQTAYTIGSTSHGTGAQRAYAIYAGFGQSPELSCSTDDMIKLSNNQVNDPIFKQLNSKRPGTRGSDIQLDAPQSHLKSISGSLLGGV